MTGRRPLLIADLAAVGAVGAGEEAALARIHALVDGGGDPFDRHALAPGHVTASAFVLHPDGGRLLLVWHRKLQRWLQPGGHVEPSDASVWKAARREVREETGLDVQRIGDGAFDVDVHRVAHDGVEHEHFDVRYLVRPAGGEPHAGDGVDEVRWVPLHEMEAMGASLRRPARKCRHAGGPAGAP
ncbi:MAG: NUDIX hydrolase [Actinobacteria bacterium]|nr:NUDIX hydrolase [Actinomycetota bacterium]